MLEYGRIMTIESMEVMLHEGGKAVWHSAVFLKH
jgi:hypothetical protein